MRQLKLHPLAASRPAASIRNSWPLDDSSRPMLTMRAVGRRRRQLAVRVRGGLQEHLVDAAADELHLRPILVAAPAIELADAELADRDDELAAADFLRQRERLGLVVFLRAVRGEAVRRSAHDADEHRDHRGVGAEVGVDVIDLLSRETSRAGRTLRRSKSNAWPGPRASRRPVRMAAASPRKKSIGRVTSVFNIAPSNPPPPTSSTARVFCCSALSRSSTSATSARRMVKRSTVIAELLQREDLAANEGLARLRVLVDQVGDGHRRLIDSGSGRHQRSNLVQRRGEASPARRDARDSQDIGRFPHAGAERSERSAAPASAAVMLFASREPARRCAVPRCALDRRGTDACEVA